ncbi:hypothetical protein F753_19390 [Stutzerimonas chloritidismutans AW-1]|uniref:CD-NTase associated protein 4-like DNA endonuclease domain-containing protein n=1 Tax=Stutzerimonas chloritidismutans AW-1 TaxID=1263865 RepID=V4Q7M2_STUCH|nr:hypothetical protein [Stutzerimonas chloritidismutans]ESQ97747.1 hypothetical protein F753_19390 [Stutzerimonas chloritidismutans AW-1]HBO2382214.1 hypothetical protein [Pseudomonas aeruginosa]
MTQHIIDRDASDKTKGFRLQKIRAIKHMLDEIESPRNVMFYASIEVQEDVSIVKIGDQETSTYFEEDKNYDEDTNFTLFSGAVLNTLVSFSDIYFSKWQESDGVVFGFYTTAGIGKERKASLQNGTILTLPDSPILKLLKDKEELSESVLSAIKYALLEEYEKQYEKVVGHGNLENLKSLSLEELSVFLSKIQWCFGQENEIALKDSVIALIKNSSLQNIQTEKKEEFIFSLLMERLDERQNLPNLVDRFIYRSDVKLIFKEVESESLDINTDPAWLELKKQQARITDKRNLEDKIRAVCPDYDVQKAGRYARMASLSKHEESESNRSFKSLKYRVFEACDQYYSEEPLIEVPVRIEEIKAVVNSIKTIAEENVKQLKSDYTYAVSNGVTIERIIFNLYDECFASFDKGVSND